MTPNEYFQSFFPLPYDPKLVSPVLLFCILEEKIASNTQWLSSPPITVEMRVRTPEEKECWRSIASDFAAGEHPVDFNDRCVRPVSPLVDQYLQITSPVNESVHGTKIETVMCFSWAS